MYYTNKLIQYVSFRTARVESKTTRPCKNWGKQEKTTTKTTTTTRVRGKHFLLIELSKKTSFFFHFISVTGCPPNTFLSNKTSQKPVKLVVLWCYYFALVWEMLGRLPSHRVQPSPGGREGGDSCINRWVWLLYLLGIAPVLVSLSVFSFKWSHSRSFCGIF